MKAAIKLVSILAIAASSFFFSARAEIIPGYPDIIICTTPVASFIFHLQRVENDGSATYMTEKAIVSVGSDGIFRRDGENDCDGKSLETLKRDGQTRNVQQQR